MAEHSRSSRAVGENPSAFWEVFFEPVFCSLQDRATFRRLIVKNNAKKRRVYEAFIESVPLLKSLEVSSGLVGSSHWLNAFPTTQWMQPHQP